MTYIVPLRDVKDREKQAQSVALIKYKQSITIISRSRKSLEN